jgi:hypothetical protein
VRVSTSCLVAKSSRLDKPSPPHELIIQGMPIYTESILKHENRETSKREHRSGKVKTHDPDMGCSTRPPVRIDGPAISWRAVQRRSAISPGENILRAVTCGA